MITQRAVATMYLVKRKEMYLWITQVKNALENEQTLSMDNEFEP